MGSIFLPVRLPLPLPAPDEAHEVGSVGGQQASVMAVRASDGDGSPVYARETNGVLRFVPTCQSYGNARPHTWIRMDFQVPAKNGVIKSGDQLVIAEFPYSNGWLHRTPFKPRNNKGSERLDALCEGVASLAEVIRLIDDLPFNVWETRQFLTASVSEPVMPQGDGKRITWKVKARLVLGTCDDFDSYEQFLLKCEEVKECCASRSSTRSNSGLVRCRFRLGLGSTMR